MLGPPNSYTYKQRNATKATSVFIPRRLLWFEIYTFVAKRDLLSANGIMEIMLTMSLQILPIKLSDKYHHILKRLVLYQLFDNVRTFSDLSRLLSTKIGESKLFVAVNTLLDDFQGTSPPKGNGPEYEIIGRTPSKYWMSTFQTVKRLSGW